MFYLPKYNVLFSGNKKILTIKIKKYKIEVD